MTDRSLVFQPRKTGIANYHAGVPPRWQSTRMKENHHEDH